MTDKEILDVILADSSLTDLAKAGNDTDLAKALAGRVGTQPYHLQITSSDVLALFGWQRGGEILSSLRAKEGPAMEVARALDRGGLDAADPSAPAFWATIDATDEEKAALIALGETSNTIGIADVGRILMPLRPDGKVDPTKVTKLETAEVENAVLSK